MSSEMRQNDRPPNVKTGKGYWQFKGTTKYSNMTRCSISHIIREMQNKTRKKFFTVIGKNAKLWLRTMLVKKKAALLWSLSCTIPMKLLIAYTLIWKVH